MDVSPDTTRRQDARKRVAIPARAYDLKRSSFIKCAVRDASKGGCMIVTKDPQELPDQLLLEVVHFKCVRKAEVVWRDKKSAGIRFV